MTTQRLPLSQIRPNPDQPRRTFDSDLLDELADSILENGLAQPITARALPNGMHEIIMGERRYRAHCRLVERGHARFAEIECHVRDATDIERDILAIIENGQRVDISPVEDARSLKRQLDLGMPIEELAKRIGRPKWRIEERLRLMGLDDSIFKLVELGQFDHHVAQVIAQLPSHTDQRELTRLWNSGTIVGFRALRAAVGAKAEGLTQTDIFGPPAAPNQTCIALRASEEEVATLNRMEMRIETIAGLAAAGWANGACIVATKVNRSRTRLMADKIREIKSALTVMEGDLRAASAQADVVLTAA